VRAAYVNHFAWHLDARRQTLAHFRAPGWGRRRSSSLTRSGMFVDHMGSWPTRRLRCRGRRRRRGSGIRLTFSGVRAGPISHSRAIDLLIDLDDLPVLPLKRVAPSRLGGLRACARREVFRASGAPRLLTWPGAAHLGSVIHSVLEDASARASLTESEAEAIFSAKLAKEERRLLESPTGRMVVPLARSVGDFEVRKRRAIHAAVARSGRSRLQGERAGAKRLLGTEVWLASQDGVVGGFVDEIADGRQGIVLRDFKSGAAARPGTPQYLNAREQLDVYAALYEEVTHTWPAQTEVVPIDGMAIAEDVAPDRSRGALEAATRAFSEINSIVESQAPSRVDTELARPAPLVCRQCDYRPVCRRYLSDPRDGENWPVDLIGTFSRSLPLRNGTILLEVAEGARVAHVRGVSNDPARHPALSLIAAGGAIGLFNLTGNAAARSLATTAITAIVGYEGLPEAEVQSTPMLQ